MSEFVNRSEYEKWKAEILEHLRKEEKRRRTWVCPACLSSISLSRVKCGCGYEAGQSMSRVLRGDITSSDLYETVRKEFHDGDRARALFLSSYLVRRFPDAEEAKHLREYRKKHDEYISARQVLPEAGHDGAPAAEEGVSSAKKKLARAAVAVAFLCVLGLVLADVFSPRIAMLPPREGGQLKNLPGPAPLPRGVAGADKGISAWGKEKTGENEFRVPLSAMGQLGFQKGRRIAKVFLSNKPLAIREKCNEAMLKAGTADADYLLGCVKGYDSYGLVWSRETAERAAATSHAN